MPHVVWLVTTMLARLINHFDEQNTFVDAARNTSMSIQSVRYPTMLDMRHRCSGCLPLYLKEVSLARLMLWVMRKRVGPTVVARKKPFHLIHGRDSSRK